jgi:hypothetical protein
VLQLPASAAQPLPACLVELLDLIIPKRYAAAHQDNRKQERNTLVDMVMLNDDCRQIPIDFVATRHPPVNWCWACLCIMCSDGVALCWEVLSSGVCHSVLIAVWWNLHCLQAGKVAAASAAEACTPLHRHVDIVVCCQHHTVSASYTAPTADSCCLRVRVDQCCSCDASARQAS